MEIQTGDLWLVPENENRWAYDGYVCDVRYPYKWKHILVGVKVPVLQCLLTKYEHINGIKGFDDHFTGLWRTVLK